MNMRRMLVLIGGLILVIGSRLPWMSVPVLFGLEGPAYESIEIGWEDNGLITGAIGFLLILGTVFTSETAGKWYSLAATLLSALAIGVVIGCFWQILEIHPSAGFFAATDIGLYVTLGGALLALSGALPRTTPRTRSLRAA